MLMSAHVSLRQIQQSLQEIEQSKIIHTAALTFVHQGMSKKKESLCKSFFTCILTVTWLNKPLALRSEVHVEFVL